MGESQPVGPSQLKHSLNLNQKMQLSIVSLVLLSTLMGVFSEPQFDYYGAHKPSFRGYPAQAYRPQFQSPAARLFFLESTIFTTTISVATTNCAYSTAALGACSGRKRRGITADDQEFAIDAAPIQRVMATQVAEMDDVRQKRQFLREDFSYDPSAIASSHYYEEPKVTHYLKLRMVVVSCSTSERPRPPSPVI